MPSRGVARLLGFKVVPLGPPFLLLVALFAQPFAATRVETRGITGVRSSQVNYLSCYSKEILD